MAYPNGEEFKKLIDSIICWGELKHEQGADVDQIFENLKKHLEDNKSQLQDIAVDKDLEALEPAALDAILKQRPSGKRKLVSSLADIKDFDNRLRGAILARFAGCILGAAVEALSIERMKGLAEVGGDAFPPVDYWHYVTNGDVVRYTKNRFWEYTKQQMQGVPVDDDIAYTLIGLLVVEEFGPNFAANDVATVWNRHLPMAYTAEEVALENYASGVIAESCADGDNPYSEWIGAWIRSDPWGYMGAGWPEVAAKMAYQDAVFSHRRNGLYGEMFFAAAVAAAFTVDEPLDAIKIALEEIPAECRLAKAIHWALSVADDVKDYQQARDMVDEKFKGMSFVHAINNACLVVFGLAIGGRDVTKVISETVAMGLDNDCTAATAASIVGAVVGADNVPEHWYEPFGNTVQSYLKGIEEFKLDDLYARFTKQAERVWEHYS